jgi:hypothetical protein
MKLVHYLGDGAPHHKIHTGIIRMTAKCGIEYEETIDYERLKRPDYTILLACMKYINPQDLPHNVKVLFGPHFFIFPEAPLIGSREQSLETRCAYNVLSAWNKVVFHEFSNDFIMPIIQCPFGVDVDYFKPVELPKTLDCILYVKRRSSDLLLNVLNHVSRLGLSLKIFIYGSYFEEDFRSALASTKFMIVLDAHESQGFALQEAMSMNVPLLVLDATSMYDEKENGRSSYEHMRPKNLYATSVPFWSDQCGMKIYDYNTIANSILYMKNNYKIFKPRDYIVAELSDEVCMRRILTHFGLS